MKKTAFFIILITIFSKIFGFAREIVLSYLYGTSNISDAYLISTTIPSVIFGFIAAGISASYIPMISKIIREKGELKANSFTSNLLNILIIIITIFVIFTTFNTHLVVKMFASGFDMETLDIAVKFTKITVYSIYFIGITTLFTGYLQVKGSYIVTSLIGLPMNFFIVVSIILSKDGNILFLPLGFVIAYLSQFLLILPKVNKNKYKHKIIFNFKDEYFIETVLISIPIILGISVNQINVLVDRTIASQIVEGGISALNYANRLNGFVMGIFVLSIITIVYPLISKMAAEKDMKKLTKLLSETITGINLFVVPATVGFMIFARPIVVVLFGRGAFNDDAISLTSQALFYYSIGMTGIGLREIFSRVFYSLQDTKIPVINAALGMILNIILNIILSKHIGLGGLALATSVSSIFTTCMMVVSLRKKIGQFGMKQISISFIKILFASLIMGFISKISFNNLKSILTQNLSLFIAIGAGAISYFAIIYFMKIEEVDLLVEEFKKKLGREVA